MNQKAPNGVTTGWRGRFPARPVSAAVIVNNVSPPHLRGVINGITETLACAMQTVGPIIFSVAFAWVSSHDDAHWPLTHHSAHRQAPPRDGLSWPAWTQRPIPRGRAVNLVSERNPAFSLCFFANLPPQISSSIFF